MLNGKTTGEISDLYPTLVTPAGYVFAIWGLIYILLLIFVVFQALPSQEGKAFQKEIGVLFVLSSAFNIVWLFLWQYGFITLSVLPMFALHATLVMIYLRLNIGKSNASLKEKLTVHLPFSAYLGWITIAAIADVATALVSINWDGFGLSATTWAIALIVAALAITLLVTFTRRDIAYCLVTIWALVGIAVEQSGNQSIVTVTEISIIVIAIALVLSISVRAKRLLPFLALIAPIILLYISYPKSFEGDPTWEGTWQGRFFYIFFLWLLLLETILSWDTLEKNKITRIGSKRTVALIIVSALPMIYVIVANFLGVNALIVDLAMQQGIHFSNLIPLVAEYFALAVLFNMIILLMYGKKGIKDFSISAFFLIIIGMLYTIDDIYPYGRFTPFQLIVPTTAHLAASVLNFMGYHTLWLGNRSDMPTYIAWDSNGHYSQAFSIAWPCAGVESLLIYTVTILLFLKRSAIPRWHKVIYFIVGAVVTYFINVLRIVSIYVSSINQGDWMRFHNIYGPLYSISWIISYPLIIIGSQLLLGRIKSRRRERKNQMKSLMSQRCLDSLG